MGSLRSGLCQIAVQRGGGPHAAHSPPVVPISESALKCALNLEDAGLDIGVFLLQIGQDRLKFGVRLKNI